MTPAFGNSSAAGPADTLYFLAGPLGREARAVRIDHNRMSTFVDLQSGTTELGLVLKAGVREPGRLVGRLSCLQ